MAEEDAPKIEVPAEEVKAEPQATQPGVAPAFRKLQKSSLKKGSFVFDSN